MRTSARTAGAGPHGAHLSTARRRHLRLWLYAGAVLTFLTLVIGGITRLTQSGLSIVEWAPIMGVVPPLSEAAWQEAFARYQAFPEFQQLRPDMTLGEFQVIYTWEYLHRLVARLIGVVFLVPFVWFWLRGYLRAPWLGRALVLLGLGALQGAMGWFMVMSGLVDRPSVSHYRLAAHLVLAFTIFGACLWFAADLKPRASRAGPEARARWLVPGLWAFGLVLALQVVWGAFTAGLDAGHMFNTFPRMAGAWLPPNLALGGSALAGLTENPALVQWSHRLLGTVLLALTVVLAAYAWRAPAGRASARYAGGLLTLVLVQYLLGVATLVLIVPVPLAAAHQAAALVTFGVWLRWLHHLRRDTAPRATAT